MGTANTYLLRPQRPIGGGPVWNTLITKTEAGAEIARQKWASPKYEFTFRCLCKTTAEAASLVSFFNTQKGSRSTFTWTNPDDGVTYTCRFVGDRLARSRIGVGRIEFDITLRGTT